MAKEVIKQNYEELRRITIGLALVLLLVLIMSVVAFYKGWLGAPGKIYLSPEENQYYIRCLSNPEICENYAMTCEEVKIVTSKAEITDHVCVKK
ncbi:MAG: hypothetical protein AABW73_00995 [Nanoarchaeota archaeon]